MLPKLVTISIIFSCIILSEAITVKDKFVQQLGTNTADTVNIKPIATVGGESIAPRNALKTGAVTFDENGAAFAVNPTPSTGDIRNSALMG
uniref:Uncharacterized protein n=1 Tax=Panagrolaimus davidi TaxID=227884 RepID=A0A914QPG5_9BILA